MQKFMHALKRYPKRLNFQFSTMKVNQISIIEDMGRARELTREQIRILNEQPRLYEEIREKQEERLSKIEEMRVYNNPYNDQNPKNLVQVKVVRGAEKPLEVAREPFILLKEPRKQKIKVEGVRRNVPGSMQKHFLFMRQIIGLQIYDAINYLSQQKRQSAKYVLHTLQMVRRHAVEKGMDEVRLFVADAITNKWRRFKKLRYHAKGRASMMKKDISQLRIRLEEKPVEEIYEMMLKGKTPASIAGMLREKLETNNASYADIKKHNWILTAKGRQQRRLFLKRRVLQAHNEFKTNGIYVGRKLIERNIVKEEAAVFTEKYNRSRQEDLQSSLLERERLFKSREES
eukprot:TRINITY_DN4953_c0_g1_i2.p1 TRINITY_DN4953_c0_g1~~TRINITY_DN4953_c0_g1_i2.p1  ORF type:complete len:345 (-),score=100.97 TRINITY_DN4953_c0_g1_i2:161-1195(-)